MKIAIIGSGISGLTAAYALAPDHDITVFEKDHRIGGHSRTIDIMEKGEVVPVDTGFIVYNEKNYPLLTRLFDHLGVETVNSDMSFGVSIDDGFLEYGSKGIFAQRRNLKNRAFWGMLVDIMRFNWRAEKYIDRHDITLGQCLDEMKMGDWFRRYYLVAMGAAIWSSSPGRMLEFPAATFIRFFKNHGLLTINGHPQWKTVKGGSRQYIKKLTASFKDKIRTGHTVWCVRRHAGSAELLDVHGGSEHFDAVVFAGHADQSLSIIEEPSADEREILGAFTYQTNTAVLHGDASLMPREKAAWASWVYLSGGAENAAPAVSLSYWMNNLQPLATPRDVFVTLNPGIMPDAGSIYDTYEFEHPVFTLDAMKAQKELARIQGQNRSYFCGAWQRYGFHEDGAMSGLAVAKMLGATPSWG